MRDVLSTSCRVEKKKKEKKKRNKVSSYYRVCICMMDLQLATGMSKTCCPNTFNAFKKKASIVSTQT